MSVYEEGCLSIPEYYEEVERPARVRFRYMNLAGRDRRAGGRRAAGDLRAARDRPPERRPVHRLPVEAQARPGDDQVQEGGEARGERGMSLRVVFMGTPEFAVPTLAEIVGQGHDVVAVYTRPPAAAGRGMELRPSPVHRMADQFGLPVFTPKTLRTEEASRDLPRPRGRCGRGRRLRHAAAEGDPRRAGTRLPQPACLPASALARRGARSSGRSWPAIRRPASPS